MWFRLMFVLALVCALPAWAQSAPEAGHNFGRIVCPQKVPCPGDYSTPQMPPDALAAAANSCITQYFGYTSPTGFFDAGAGVNSSNCLNATPGLIPKGMGAQLIQACCIVQTAPNSCALRCELNAQ